MDRHRDDLKSIDPKLPHLFIERLNLPYDIPKGGIGPGATVGPQTTFKRTGVSDSFAVCRLSRSDQIHTASEAAADSEQWPI